MALAEAVSGLARKVRPPLPCRPSKLRLLVETLYWPGESWSPFMAMHLEQAGGGAQIADAQVGATAKEDYVDGVSHQRLAAFQTHVGQGFGDGIARHGVDRKSTRLNSSHR